METLEKKGKVKMLLIRVTKGKPLVTLIFL